MKSSVCYSCYNYEKIHLGLNVESFVFAFFLFIHEITSNDQITLLITWKLKTAKSWCSSGN